MVGVDIAEEMLAVARGRLEAAGLGGRARLTRADARKLPLLEERFDAQFMSFTLELSALPDIPRVLSECRRVARPRGGLAVVGLERMGRPMVRLYERVHLLQPRIADCRPIRVAAALEENGRAVQRRELRSMAGLPLELALGRAPAQGRGDG